jgi:hypothetical protein
MTPPGAGGAGRRTALLVGRDGVSRAQAGSGDAAVLVDQPAETAAPADVGEPCRRRRQGHEIRAIRRREIQGTVRAVSVVVIDVGPQHPLKVAAVGDQQPAQALSPAVPTNRSAIVGPGSFDRSPDDLDSLAAEDLVEGAAELGVVVSDQEPGRRPPVRKLPGEVPRLLGDPGSAGVRCA